MFDDEFALKRVFQKRNIINWITHSLKALKELNPSKCSYYTTALPNSIFWKQWIKSCLNALSELWILKGVSHKEGFHNWFSWKPCYIICDIVRLYQNIQHSIAILNCNRNWKCFLCKIYHKPVELQYRSLYSLICDSASR